MRPTVSHRTQSILYMCDWRYVPIFKDLYDPVNAVKMIHLLMNDLFLEVFDIKYIECNLNAVNKYI